MHGSISWPLLPKPRPQIAINITKPNHRSKQFSWTFWTFSRGYQRHQGHQSHDDDDYEEEDNKVEDNDNDNDKGISALGLDRDLGFSQVPSCGTPMT